MNLPSKIVGERSQIQRKLFFKVLLLQMLSTHRVTAASQSCVALWDRGVSIEVAWEIHLRVADYFFLYLHDGCKSALTLYKVGEWNTSYLYSVQCLYYA